MLILSRSGEHRVAAEALRRSKRIVVRLRDEVADESLLPGSVLHYVLDTRQSVVVDDASTRARFAAILMSPNTRRGRFFACRCSIEAKLVGVLLLENDSASGVFTPTRIRTLKLVVVAGSERSRKFASLRRSSGAGSEDPTHDRREHCRDIHRGYQEARSWSPMTHTLACWDTTVRISFRAACAGRS